MKEFLNKNFNIIVLIVSVLTFFKSCGDSRQISKMNQKMDNFVTKEEHRKITTEVFETEVSWKSLRIEEISDKEKISINALQAKEEILEKKD